MKRTVIWRLRFWACSFREAFCNFSRSALSWSTPISSPLSEKKKKKTSEKNIMMYCSVSNQERLGMSQYTMGLLTQDLDSQEELLGPPQFENWQWPVSQHLFLLYCFYLFPIFLSSMYSCQLSYISNKIIIILYMSRD